MGQALEESRAGELLNASYELHERTSPGAVSDSYRATDRRRKKTVQVTLLRPEFALQSAVVERFLHAGKTLTGLRHPNVSQVVAVESDDTGIPYVVEEDVQGERLAQTLRAFPDGMPLDMALRVVLPVVEAIAAAHTLGIVHGQLDGEHVVLVKSGAISLPKVVRFGAIAAGDQDSEVRARRAPELRTKDGRANADVRSDVWALGALLYETLCGRPPSESASDRAVLEESVPNLPSELSDLISRCLERNPTRRPSRAKDVRTELSLLRISMNPSAPAMPSTPVKANAPAAPSAKAAPIASAKAAPIASAKPAPIASAKAAPIASAKPAPVASAKAAQPSAKPVPSAKPAPNADAKVVPSTPAAKPAKPGDAAAQDFALGATLFQQAAPQAEPARAEPPRRDSDHAVPMEFDVTRPERPRNSSPAAPRLSGAPASLPEIKTLSDLADAFGPIDGANHIQQSETEGAVRARGFRQAMDAAAESSPKKKPRTREERPAPILADRPSRAGDAAGRPVAPLLSPKQLKQGAGTAPRAMTKEQVMALNERLKAAEPRSWRAFGDGLLLAFGIALLFMLPFLTDADRSKAQAAFGTHAPIAFIGLAVLSIVAVVRTSVMNSQSAPMMLGPLSWTLKIVTVCTCVLCAAYNLPVGAFGPAEMAARMAFPWAASAFLMAGGAYGLLFGIRESANNLIYGVVVATLFSGGFYGSYRTMMAGVHSVAAARAHRRAGMHDAEGSMASLRKFAAGKTEQADAGMQMEGRHEVGSSEEEDMRSIEHMKDAQHDQAGKFDALHQQIEKVAH